ncbi:class I SAM-dependent methyltransferase [Actinomadura macrotermitis]|uniref:class I SAM-dependent methyltransferase n=1 Tax=Actinomadura macrotermitis TaxID=2585200 RepID=UPI001886980B|nr:class I SAM-dependent methyltransferase [Actinomadura macrotermitis]
MPDSVLEITRATCAVYDANSDLYGDISEEYGRFPGLLEEVVDFAERAPGGLPLLDLGCGSGRDGRFLASLGRRVVAGDYAPAMLVWARDRSLEEGDSLRFLRLNALELPFCEFSIAGVWASGSLLHVPLARMEQALREVYRVLVPGGITKISMRSGEGEGWKSGGSLEGERWFTFVSPEVFAEHLRSAGFANVQTRFSGRPGWYVAFGVR